MEVAVSDGGQHRAGSGKPPISSRIPAFPPQGGDADGGVAQRAAQVAKTVGDAAVAVGYHPATSQRTPTILRLLGAAGLSAAVAFLVTRQIYRGRS